MGKTQVLTAKVVSTSLTPSLAERLKKVSHDAGAAASSVVEAALAAWFGGRSDGEIVAKIKRAKLAKRRDF